MLPVSFYLPPKLPPLRPNPLLRRTEGREVRLAELRPKAPRLICFEGFRFWKLFCERVGFFSGALMPLVALFPAFGEVDLPFILLLDDFCRSLLPEVRFL